MSRIIDFAAPVGQKAGVYTTLLARFNRVDNVLKVLAIGMIWTCWR
jgi:hypothetical protein